MGCLLLLKASVALGAGWVSYPGAKSASGYATLGGWGGVSGSYGVWVVIFMKLMQFHFFHWCQACDHFAKTLWEDHSRPPLALGPQVPKNCPREAEAQVVTSATEVSLLALSHYLWVCSACFSSLPLLSTLMWPLLYMLNYRGSVQATRQMTLKIDYCIMYLQFWCDPGV